MAEKLVCFTVGGQELGAPIRAVKETLPERPITRVFLTPRILAGLTNLRGEVVAVIHLARLLELPDESESEHNIVILRSERANRAAAGLLVDRLLGVRDVGDAEVQPPPATLAPEPASYLRGIARAAGIEGPPRPLLLLDVERVLQTERLRPFRRAQG